MQIINIIAINRLITTFFCDQKFKENKKNSLQSTMTKLLKISIWPMIIYAQMAKYTMKTLYSFHHSLSLQVQLIGIRDKEYSRRKTCGAARHESNGLRHKGVNNISYLRS